MMAGATFTGGKCLCGSVVYSLTAQPVASLVCLCTQCQTIAGGFGVGSVVIPVGGLIVESGSELIAEFVLPGSSVGLLRRFCKICGTHLFALNPKHPVVAVHAGTLSESASFSPQVVIWCQSKREYHRFAEGVPQFEQYPPGPK
jgi:hypothetical protein